MMPTQPLADLKVLQPVAGLQPVEGLQPVAPLTFNTNNYNYRTGPRSVNMRASKPTSVVQNFFSPDQRARLLEDYGLGAIKDIPLLSQLAGVGFQLYDSYINPIVENGVLDTQGYKEVVLNSIREIGEDLDILSNIVKSQFTWAGGEVGLTTLANSLGLNGTRTVYNFNTGNTLLDIAGEFLSDPVNLVTLGASTFGKLGTQDATRELTEMILKKSSKKLSQQTAQEFAVGTAKAISKYDKNTTYELILKHLKPSTVKAIRNAGLKQAAPDLIHAYLKTDGYRLFTNASKIKTTLRDADALYTDFIKDNFTPIGLIKYVKPKFVSGLKSILSTIHDNYADYDLARDFVKITGEQQSTLSSAIYKNNALQETIFKNNRDFFTIFNTNPTELQDAMYDLLKQNPDIPADELYETYFRYLKENLKSFRGVHDDVIKEVAKNPDAQEFIDALVVAPVAILTAEQTMTKQYNSATVRSMQKYFKEHQSDLANIYKYVDETVLSIGDVHYGLDHIEDFLKNLQINRDKKYIKDVTQLLEPLGITVDNAKKIKKVLSSNITDKTKSIKRIIENNKEGLRLFTDNDYRKIIKQGHEYIDDIKQREINKIWTQDIFKNNAAPKDLIKNMQQAVEMLSKEMDQQHALMYIYDNIRMQDIAVSDRFNDLIKRLKRYNPEIVENLKKEIRSIQNYLDKTTHIMEQIQKTGVTEDIPLWWAAVNDAKHKIGRLNQQLLLHGGPYAVEPRELLKQIYESIETFTSEKLKDNYVNYLTNLSGTVRTQLTHLSMFNVLTQHTHLSKSITLNSFLEQFSNPNSIVRTQIVPDLIDKFNKAGMYQQAQNLIKVTAQVDTVMNLTKLIQTELPTQYKLSKALQSDLKTIVFDIIDNNKYCSLSDLMTMPIDSYEYTQQLAALLEELRKTGNTDLMLYTLNHQPTMYDKLISSIDYRLDKTENILKKLRKETVGYDFNKVKADVKQTLHDLLDDYINAQSTIRGVDNLTLSTMYNQETIDMLKLAKNIRYDLARHAEVTTELLDEYDMLSKGFEELSEGIGKGIRDIEKRNNKIARYINNYELTKQLVQHNTSYNLMSASIESNMYGTKYMVPIKEVRDMFKLEPTDIVGNNNEYIMLINKLDSYKDLLHEPYKYGEKYIEKLRNTLIDTYSVKNALFAPKNVSSYFKSLDAQQLLAWEMVSKGSLSTRNKTNFYTFFRKHVQDQNLIRISKSDAIANVEAVLKQGVSVNEDALAEALIIAKQTNALEYANRSVDAYLRNSLHDLDDLGKHRSDLVKYLEQNTEAVNDVYKTVTAIENSKEIIESISPYKNFDDPKRLLNLDYGYADTKFDNLTTMYAERKSSLAIALSKMTPEQLATHIYKQTPGGMVFYNQNIIRTINPDNTVTWSGIDDLFNFSKQELKKAGLKIQQDGDWYYLRLTDNRVHNAKLDYGKLITEYNAQQDFTNLLDKYRLYLNMYTNEDVPMNLVTAEALNEDTWQAFLDAHQDFFGDFEEQKLYQKFTPGGYSTFFDKSFSRLNLAIVGGYDSYNLWNSLYSQSFIPHSLQLSSNTLSGLTSFITRSNKINKYLTLFFNNDYSLDNPLFKTMFSEASDERIAEFFKEGKYKSVILRADKQGLPKVFEYYIEDRKTLEKAIEARAILVPIETYAAMKQVVNSRKMTNSLLDIYRRVVPSTYKSMYLFTAGFPFRNALDSLLYKNINELGGITEIPRVLAYEREASKAIEFHNKIQKQVLELTEYTTFNKEALNRVLSNYTKDEANLYYLIDLFMNSGASGGLSESLGTFIEGYNKLHTEDLRAAWETFYEDKVLFGEQWYNPLHHMHNLNDHIEKTARLGLFLASVDEGLPIQDAIDRVIKTHFNYKDPSDILEMCERVFWFSTFPINNLNYYINEGFSKSPTLLKLAMDTQIASWNNGEYTYEELKKTNFLAYHAMTGNIRIGNVIIKTSPSLFDFINLVGDLPGNVRDRLNPFLSIVTGNAENIAEELDPFITQERNFQKMLDGNPIPSILSFIDEPDKYNRAMYKWRSTRTPSNWTKYPKIRKAPAYTKYVRKYYARRYHTNVRKLTRTSLWHDAYRYYKVARRSPTYYDL